jgi:hypothetical protein
MGIVNEIHNRYLAKVQSPVGRIQEWGHCIRWCEEQWGNMGDWFYMGGGVFEFNNEKDYTWFMLRWG